VLLAALRYFKTLYIRLTLSGLQAQFNDTVLKYLMVPRSRWVLRVVDNHYLYVTHQFPPHTVQHVVLFWFGKIFLIPLARKCDTYILGGLAAHLSLLFINGFRVYGSIWKSHAGCICPSWIGELHRAFMCPDYTLYMLFIDRLGKIYRACFLIIMMSWW